MATQIHEAVIEALAAEQVEDIVALCFQRMSNERVLALIDELLDDDDKEYLLSQWRAL